MSTSDQVTTDARAPAPGAADDEAILAAIRSEQRQRAAELLLEKYGAAIGRACMALLGSQRDAEEIVEATLADALARREGFPGASSLRAWLLGLARRRAAARLAARAGTDSAVAEQAAEAAEGPSAARRLLRQLKPTEREALVLRFATELEFAELAAACAVDTAQAAQRVARGLDRLARARGEEAS